eukprot:g29715.t1
MPIAGSSGIIKVTAEPGTPGCLWCRPRVGTPGYQRGGGSSGAGDSWFLGEHEFILRQRGGPSAKEMAPKECLPVYKRGATMVMRERGLFGLPMIEQHKMADGCPWLMQQNM